MNNSIPENADSLSPVRLIDALKLVKNGFQPVSGGTDLLIRRHSIEKAESHKLGGNLSSSFKPVFYAGRIAELGRIFIPETGKDGDDSLEIGSCVTLSEIIASPLCPPLLAEALESIASPGIRNIATLTGNICNASPAGDSLTVLYILDAVIQAASLGEGDLPVSRKIAISDFITGPGKTALGAGELVTGVSLPLPSGLKAVFRKIGTRAANALSKLSLAAVWKIEDHIFTDFRLAVGACGPRVIRSRRAEDLIRGCRTADIENQLEQILSVYSSVLIPIDDQRSTAEYRKNTALKLIKQIILDAGGR
ncbi:MAG: FAD binding domain-containing protein [Spirochaetales bacterium]|nr:FAD binding domain-containing protein [Spirochaetales bacterium]